MIVRLQAASLTNHDFIANACYNERTVALSLTIIRQKAAAMTQRINDDIIATPPTRETSCLFFFSNSAGVDSGLRSHLLFYIDRFDGVLVACW